MTGSDFLITIRSQPKHGALYAAAKRLGGIEPLAESLGWSKASVFMWINLRGYPRSLFSEKGRLNSGQLEPALQRVIGMSLDECWPQEIQDFIDRTRHLKSLIFEQTKEVPLPRLTAAMQKRLTVEGGQERAATIAESKQIIGRVLRALPFREREVLKLRFGLDGSPGCTLEEVAQVFKVTRERIREIEAKAIRKLQHPLRSRELVGLIDSDRVC